MTRQTVLGGLLDRPECNDLEFVVAAWPRLPEHVQLTIKTLVQAQATLGTLRR